MKGKTIYVFGNPLLPYDSLPIKLVPKLKKSFPGIKFFIKDPNENLEPKNGELWIIDTIMVPSNQCPVPSQSKVKVIKDIDAIQLSKIYSAHDFDLGFNLKLLQKIGKLKKVVIFGIPAGMDEKKALKQLSNKIYSQKV